MAIIGPVTLTITRDVANAVIKVTYKLTGDERDIASKQPYIETCRLIGDDTHPGGDGTDDSIPNGLLQSRVVSFPNEVALLRAFTVTRAAADLNEDAGIFAADVDEIRAVVTLIPVPVATRTAESNQVLFNQLIDASTTVAADQPSA